MQPGGVRGPGRRAVLVVATAGLVAACSRPEVLGGDRVRGSVVLSTGGTKGVYYAWGRALAEQVHRAHPRLSVRVVDSSGSVENLRRILARACDVAVGTEDVLYDAGMAGRIVALARVYDDYVHVVVRADSPHRTLSDLTGRPVAVGQPGSGVAVVARRVLDAAQVRVDEKPIDVVLGTRALADGFVDAVFWSGGLPTAAVSELADRLPIRLLPLDRIAPTLRRSFQGVYRPATVSPGRYGITEPLPTIATANLMFSMPDAPAPVVEGLLDSMFRRRDAIAAAVPAANAMDRRKAVLTGSLRLQVAAESHYRQAKP